MISGRVSTPSGSSDGSTGRPAAVIQMFLIQGYDRLLQATYFYLPKFLYDRFESLGVRSGLAFGGP